MYSNVTDDGTVKVKFPRVVYVDKYVHELGIVGDDDGNEEGDIVGKMDGDALGLEVGKALGIGLG